MVKKILTAAAVLLAGAAYGQPTPLRIPPKYTVATAPACVDGEPKLFAVTDGSSSTDCTVGGGSTEVICKCTDGTAAAVGSGGGGSSNSFETINAPAGTDPVADSATDTLNITCAGGLTCTGTAATDTLDITMGTAATATALAADPSDCAANTFAQSIAASGNLTCAAISDADVPDGITVTLAGTATALAANGANCSAGQYPLGVDASGAAESCTADDTGTDDQTATEVSYTPTTGTDWTDPDPASAGEGLDDLAARLTVEEAKADDDVPESGDFGAATDLDADGAVSANAVALGTDTTGDYVSSATASQGLTLTGTEGASLGLQDCAATEVLKRNAGDTAWECAADATGSGIGGSTGATDDAVLVADGTGGATAAASLAFVDSSAIFRLGGANSNKYPALRPKSDNSGTFEVVRAANPVSAWGNISTEGGRISASLISISPGTSSAVTMYGSSSLLQLGTSAGIAWTDNSSAEAGSLNLSLKRSSGGVLIVGNGSTGIGSLLNAVLVEANTAGSGTPNAIAATESGTVFTNEGVTAKNFHTLPSAVAGYKFTFIVQDTDGLRIVANTGDDIHIGATVSTTAGYCESTTVGDSVTLVSINTTSFYAVAMMGSGWTCAILFPAFGVRRRLRDLIAANDNL